MESPVNPKSDISRHTLLAACLGSALGGMLLMTSFSSLQELREATASSPIYTVIEVAPTAVPAIEGLGRAGGGHGCPYLAAARAAHAAAGIEPASR